MLPIVSRAALLWRLVVVTPESNVAYYYYRKIYGSWLTQ
jgi:hypothetical protein